MQQFAASTFYTECVDINCVM